MLESGSIKTIHKWRSARCNTSHLKVPLRYLNVCGVAKKEERMERTNCQNSLSCWPPFCGIRCTLAFWPCSWYLLQFSASAVFSTVRTDTLWVGHDTNLKWGENCYCYCCCCFFSSFSLSHTLSWIIYWKKEEKLCVFSTKIMVLIGTNRSVLTHQLLLLQLSNELWLLNDCLCNCSDKATSRWTWEHHLSPW